MYQFELQLRISHQHQGHRQRLSTLTNTKQAPASCKHKHSKPQDDKKQRDTTQTINPSFKYLNKTMNLTVKTLKGGKFTVEVGESNTVAQVKEVIVSPRRILLFRSTYWFPELKL
jgi:sRNA-binding protein